jgi:hypothetical protein
VFVGLGGRAVFVAKAMAVRAAVWVATKVPAVGVVKVAPAEVEGCATLEKVAPGVR